MNASGHSSFNREAAIAALFTAAGFLALNSSLLLNTVAPPHAESSMSYWLTALVGGYLLWLCSRSDGRSGRPTLLLIWLIGTVAGAVFSIGSLWTGAWHLLMISITRCALFYPKPLALLADLSLSAAAGLAAIVVCLHSGSLLLTLWSFFLLQAGWTWIGDWQRARGSARAPDRSARRFDNAHATATTAIRRMSQQNL